MIPNEIKIGSLIIFGDKNVLRLSFTVKVCFFGVRASLQMFGPQLKQLVGQEIREQFLIMFVCVKPNRIE